MSFTIDSDCLLSITLSFWRLFWISNTLFPSWLFSLSVYDDCFNSSLPELWESFKRFLFILIVFSSILSLNNSISFFICSIIPSLVSLFFSNSSYSHFCYFYLLKITNTVMTIDAKNVNSLTYYIRITKSRSFENILQSESIKMAMNICIETFCIESWNVMNA